jgi:hypothetical protein
MGLSSFNNLLFQQGIGGSTILRGKFFVIGEQKDQLWMQIWRFGFGRSVSGSVYSEGTYLTKDDEKSYWGRIKYLQDEKIADELLYSTGTAQTPPSTNKAVENPKLLLVKGSVIFGYGLEPQPVGHFILTETESVSTTTEESDYGIDDDDDYETDSYGFSTENSKENQMRPNENGHDQPYFGSDNAFQ